MVDCKRQTKRKPQYIEFTKNTHSVICFKNCRKWEKRLSENENNGKQSDFIKSAGFHVEEILRITSLLKMNFLVLLRFLIPRYKCFLLLCEHKDILGRLRAWKGLKGLKRLEKAWKGLKDAWMFCQARDRFWLLAAGDVLGLECFMVVTIVNRELWIVCEELCSSWYVRNGKR